MVDYFKLETQFSESKNQVLSKILSLRGVSFKTGPFTFKSEITSNSDSFPDPNSVLEAKFIVGFTIRFNIL